MPELIFKGSNLSPTTKRWWCLVVREEEKQEGWTKCFPNTQTKERVCELQSVWIHLRWAEQACWQGNTWGEGQPSTLCLCWRQWHNSNTCRVHASSFLNLLSSLWQAAAKTRCGTKPSSQTQQQNNNWSGVLSGWNSTQPHGVHLQALSCHKSSKLTSTSLEMCYMFTSRVNHF